MARASLLGLLAWALSVQLAGTCLRCWPDAAKYFSYDARLLLKDTEAADKLETLFLGSTGDLANYGGRYLEREHMEREAGNLFLHLERIIQKSGQDRDHLIKEAEQEKQNFIKQLKEASQAFLKEICRFSCGQSRYKPYEVAECTSCQVIKAPCNDPMVCAGPSVLAAILVTFALLLILGIVVCYRRRKKKAEGKAKEGREAREGEEEEPESSFETSEWSDDTIQSPSENRVFQLPEYYNIPQSPKYQNIPGPLDFNVPQVPMYENIPSPPVLNIPSPPAGDDAGD